LQQVEVVVALLHLREPHRGTRLELHVHQPKKEVMLALTNDGGWYRSDLLHYPRRVLKIKL
jgi:hypothetical protein